MEKNARRRYVEALREEYAEAKKDIGEPLLSLDVLHFRKGYVEGIRRCAVRLFGVIDADFICGGPDPDLEEETKS